PVKGPIKMRFTIWEKPNGGVALWSEVQSSVPLIGGTYAVVVGSTMPLPRTLFDGRVMYLGITVGADSKMTPRVVLASVPYAVLASDVVGDISPHSVSVNG